MTENKSFERFVADHLADDGSGSAQADRISALTYDKTDDVRQLPRWLAFLKEPPMRISSSLAVGSPAARIAAIMVATILLALMVAAAGIAGSRLLAAGPVVVDQSGGGDYTTITAAVAKADDDSTILVKPGDYSEAFVIDKDITLMGDGPVEEIVITAPEGGPVHDTRYSYMGEAPYAILLSSADAQLSGLTLRGESSRLFADGGSPLIEKVSFDGVGEPYVGSAVVSAVVINGGGSATVRDSTFISGGGIDVFETSVP